VPARQYLLQALPIAIEVLNLYSEAEREGYLTRTLSAHAPSSKGAGSLYSSNCRQYVFSETPDSPGPIA
jgi:hypothetical protein